MAMTMDMGQYEFTLIKSPTAHISRAFRMSDDLVLGSRTQVLGELFEINKISRLFRKMIYEDYLILINLYIPKRTEGNVGDIGNTYDTNNTLSSWKANEP